MALCDSGRLAAASRGAVPHAPQLAYYHCRAILASCTVISDLHFWLAQPTPRARASQPSYDQRRDGLDCAVPTTNTWL